MRWRSSKGGQCPHTTNADDCTVLSVEQASSHPHPRTIKEADTGRRWYRASAHRVPCCTCSRPGRVHSSCHVMVARLDEGNRMREEKGRVLLEAF